MFFWGGGVVVVVVGIFVLCFFLCLFFCFVLLKESGLLLCLCLFVVWLLELKISFFFFHSRVCCLCRSLVVMLFCCVCKNCRDAFVVVGGGSCRSGGFFCCSFRCRLHLLRQEEKCWQRQRVQLLVVQLELDP